MRSFILLYACLLAAPVAWGGALHDAVQEGDVPTIKTLVMFGTDLDERDDKGRTPLHYAALAGREDLALLLLDGGANPDIPILITGGEATLLDMAIRKGLDELKGQLLARGGFIAAPRDVELYDAADPTSLRGRIGKGGMIAVGAYDHGLDMFAVKHTTSAGKVIAGLANVADLGMTRPNQPKTGVPISVKVKGESDAEYVIYLPTSYSRKTPPPVIFGCAPTGNGMDTVRDLKKAAEEHGWIVVGCNNLGFEMGAFETLTMHHIMQDVRKNYPHDLRREYFMGFGKVATHAYRLTRRFWNEFAGIIAIGGYMGVYDRRYVYPQRTAVAVVNGRADRAANSLHEKDLMILRVNEVPRRFMIFEGGHEMPPVETTHEAIGWLEDQWKKQVQSNDQLASAEAESKRITAEIEAATNARNHAKALQLAVQLAIDLPFTVRGQAANRVIEDIMLDPTKRSMAATRGFEDAPDHLREILLYRVRDRQGFPWRDQIARYELAHAAHTKSAEAATELAYVLASCPDKALRDLKRAEELATFATQKEGESWFAWHARALVAARTGYPARAIDYQKKALDHAPNNKKAVCLRSLKRYEAM